LYSSSSDYLPDADKFKAAADYQAGTGFSDEAQRGSGCTLISALYGYFAGKGMMHNRIVIPFHNKDGALVAYAGTPVEDGTYRYPEMFVREHELFNLYRAQAAAESSKPVILVTDYFDVFRLYEAEYRFAVALSTEKLSLHQLSYLLDLVGA